MSAARKKLLPPDDDPPLTTVERAALAALGWRHAGSGRRADGLMTLSFVAPGAAPDALPEQRTRAEWRAILAAGQAERAINAGDADTAEQLLDQAEAKLASVAPIRRGAPLRLSATAVAAFTPGPDADGVFRRPPDMPERVMADPRTLVDGRWQPRKAYRKEAMAELEDSVREHGVLEELLAVVNEQGELELVTGHRRKRAALAIGCPTVPVKILEVTAKEARGIAIISNDQRDDLTEVERGQAYEEAIAELGISEVELAKQLGKPRTYVQQRRQLARAVPEVQAALVAGEISFTQGRLICQGSGGDAAAQRAALALIAEERGRGRIVGGEEAQRRAERHVREQTAPALKKLGWSVADWWPKNGDGNSTRYFFYAPTARPAQWSSSDMLAAVAEGRRPPAGPGPAALAGEDRTALEFAGWELSDRCAPWALMRKGKELLVGDATDFATQIATARAELAKVTARFERAGWGVSWRGAKLKATPPAPDGTGKKSKAKGPDAVEVRGLSEARGLVDKIEKGIWTPETKTSRGYDYRADCARCGTKTSDYAYLDGSSYCRECQPIVKAELEQLRAKFVAVVERDLGAWLDGAPELAGTLLLLQSNSDGAKPRGPELRGIFTNWLWRYRSRFKFAEQPAETPAPARRALAEILAELSVIEERWAGGGMGSADGDTLEALAEDLEAQIGELDPEVYDAAAAQIAGLLRRLLEQGVPS